MKYLFTLFIITLSITTNGQTIIGQWETYDDKTNEKKAIIEVYKTDDFYFAKIVESFVGEKNAICETCKGTQKDKPIIGLVIIENIKKDGKEFNGGSILDPENGETYKCYLKLINKNKLKVRGYLGFSLFGRTQYWIRKQ
jgi:uncharacterized protein (DUF2147 family)